MSMKGVPPQEHLPIRNGVNNPKLRALHAPIKNAASNPKDSTEKPVKNSVQGSRGR
jgi:hypothetical protein